MEKIMVMLPCPNCKKLTDPYLDKTSNLVYCSSCDQEIEQVNHFTKYQLKELKKYKTKPTNSFQVKCPKCNKEERPILSSNDVVICSFCKSPLSHLTEPFQLMLKEQLKKLNQM